MQLYNATTSTEDLHTLIMELAVSDLGCYGQTGIRAILRRIRYPCDIIAVDWRKLHEWNLDDMLGYDRSSATMGRFIGGRQGYDGRAADVRGQWGGDEFIIACGVGHGVPIMMRLVARLDALTAELSPDLRARMHRHTGGLIDSFAAVFVLCQRSTHPLIDATRAINELGLLKKGAATGDRATSGAPGTIIGSIRPYEEKI